MERQIKFRAKRLDNGEWVHGDLLKPCTQARIVNYDESCDDVAKRADYHYFDVDDSTICQFTGLLDCNGKEIYEGDILVFMNDIIQIVEFKYGMFGYTVEDEWFIGFGSNPNFTINPLGKSIDHVVIGNVFDNPELLTDKLNKQ